MAGHERRVKPILDEAKAHYRAQAEAASRGDTAALLREERAHAARLAHQAEVILEYEAIRASALSHVPIDERLDALLQSICAMLGSQAAAVLLMDEEGEQLWPRASLGFQTTLAVRPVPVTGAVWDIMRTGTPLILSDIQPGQQFREGLLEEGLRSLVAVPMRISGALAGVLLCCDPEPNHFRPEDTDRLQSLADLVAAGFHRARALETQTRHRRRSDDASRFKSELLQMATHDIKTPLSTLAVQLHLLAEPGLTEEQRHRGVALMQRNVARLGAMLDDFLDLARIQGNRLTIHPAPLRVDRLLQETVESFTLLAQKNGLALAASPMGDVEALGDERRILQVLANLVSNAIRYSPPGGSIVVSALEAPDHVAVHVLDQGRGMTAEQMAKLFQPFVQLHDVPGNSKGSGLGLYLSKAIVEAHGGRLWLASPGPGLGTDAAFTLPKRTPKEPPA